MAALSLVSACTRIETGEVGVRVNFSKEVQSEELKAGSWNQTIIGSVLTFPVRDITVDVSNKNPLTADNSALADFDLQVDYTISPDAVADLYVKQPKSFHVTSKDDDILLMYRFVETAANNAAFKAVRQFKALELADKRDVIEEQIKSALISDIQDKSLSGSLTVSNVRVLGIALNPQIVESNAAVVKAQNDLKVKELEVQSAKKEAERMDALSKNGGASIAYMQAQAQLMLAEAAKEGKIGSVVLLAPELKNANVHVGNSVSGSSGNKK